MKTCSYLILAAVGMAIAAGCTSDVPMVSLGIDDTYVIPRMRKLALESAFTGEEYRWTCTNPAGVTSVIGTEREIVFLAEEEGDYHLRFEVIDAATPYSHEFKVSVVHEEIEYSPYITKVYEYCPAPGQFINEMPRYEDGDTHADMAKKAEDCISGTNDEMISLGGYGGYVTFGFDHTVINHPGEADFRVWGNCFYELTQPDKKGGSAEPGIVMVSYDRNCNGLPDDDWYELAGSDYNNPLTLHGYSITYHKPDPDREIIGDDSGFLSDLNYIAWNDSEGECGFMPANIFHIQDYYPKWVEASTLTFSGSLLPPNAEDISGIGSYYVLYSFGWGYVDNHPNDYADLNSFDISNAVDRYGNPVMLPGADFIRVYTGVNQYCGWLGETSTELCRAADLHIDLPGIPLPDPLASAKEKPEAYD